MSTHLPGRVAHDDSEPITLPDLTEYFAEGGKPEPDWRLGAEFEKFALDRTTGRQLSYAEPGGIGDILAALVRQFGWEPHYEGGHLTTLSRGGETVSLEPGGQVEFSTSPVRGVGEVAAELNRHRDELHAVVDPARVAWVASGVTPFSRVEDIPLGPRDRHAVMAVYLPARCPMAHHMMKATASTQVAFDYSDEADAGRKFGTALRLSPVVNAVWGNSPLYAGEPTGWASYRGRIWLGMDPARCGLLEELLADGLTFERWVRYLLDVPMLFHLRGGEYREAGGRTFRDFLTHGIDGRFPTRGDWGLHLTTVFPEVRMKQFIEVRGADATPPALALAVPAFWKGLLYDADALIEAERIAVRFAPAALPSLFESAAKLGLDATHDGHTVRAWATELARVAAAGLRRQAGRWGEPSEEGYLDPVRAALEAGRSPGSAFLSAGMFGVGEVISRFEF